MADAMPILHRSQMFCAAGMSANERAELEAMHAHERQLCDQLDKLDEELHCIHGRCNAYLTQKLDVLCCRDECQ